MSLREVKGMAAGILLLVAAGCGGACTPPENPYGEVFVDTHIRNLCSEESTVRFCAATTLGNLGPQAARALPALGCTVEDPDCNVRCAAKIAIMKIGQEPLPLGSAPVLDRSRHD
jgi:hypothetical protein